MMKMGDGDDEKERRTAHQKVAQNYYKVKRLRVLRGVLQHVHLHRLPIQYTMR